MSRVLIAMAQQDFDPTEVAIPWKILRAAGHEIVFATPGGKDAHADELMLTGVGLDVWGFVPGLKHVVVMGAVLRANAEARAAYRELEETPEFHVTKPFRELRAEDFDALVLPGGHRARGMRSYLESTDLQALVVGMFEAAKPVGAICHGVLVAARALSPRTGHSVLYGRRTTSLTWAQERLAWSIGRVVRFWDPSYYRTYLESPGEPAGFMGVEQEITRALASPADYVNVPQSDPNYALKTSGRHRDTLTDDRPAFVVRDGDYVSARWPGDAHTFARELAGVIDERAPRATARH